MGAEKHNLWSKVETQLKKSEERIQEFQDLLHKWFDARSTLKACEESSYPDWNDPGLEKASKEEIEAYNKILQAYQDK